LGLEAENTPLAATLKQKLSSLALPIPEAGNGSVVASQITGKTFVLGLNDRHLKTMNFQFKDSVCHVSMMIDSNRYDFSFGSGQWIPGETTLHGPNLLLLAKAHFVGLPPAKVVGSFCWKDENTLELVLRYIESPHTETITCRFDKNFEANIIRPELKGVAKD